jgi:RimJ/RimL family protein N-acetyltransferase
MNNTNMKKRIAINIKNQRLTLRPLRESHASAPHRHLADGSAARWTLRIPHPYPNGEGLRFIRWSRWAMNRGRAYTLAVVPAGSSEVVGVISLDAVDHDDRLAELGYWSGPGVDDRGRWFDGRVRFPRPGAPPVGGPGVRIESRFHAGVGKMRF